jgi:tetratricopeptide (TPR) repeat protein
MVCYRAALFDANKIIKYQDAPAADWYSTRSFTLSKLGKYKQALADANRAIELQPQNARAYIARAYAHLGLKEILNALTDCNTARSISPSLQGLELCYAQIFSEEHNWLAAVDATSKVLVAQPDKVKARYLRAAAYSELGHFTQAADDATIAILQNPAALHAYITRAQAYYHSGKFQSALYDAQEAINIRPNLAKSKELSFVADLKHKIGSLHNTSCSSASDGPK